MKILETLALDGPNVWSRNSVLEARIELSGWEPLLTTELADFRRRLTLWLPGITFFGDSLWHCQEPLDGACAARQVAQTLLDVTATIQAKSHQPASLTQLSPTSERLVFALVVAYEEAALTRACLEFARDLCLAARQETIDLARGLARLRDLADEICLGCLSAPLVAAARKRDIPVRRLNTESLVQLGHGARQRRIQTAVCDRTGMVAESVSLDKELTKSLLREVGIPVPAGRPVANREDAWRAACELGVPVVVKPRDGDYGNGVGLNLRSQEQILAAYDDARQYREEVLVERFALGSQHRITIVGDRVVAAVRRVPPQIVGDGLHSVSQLIDEANLDPRRGGPDDPTPLARIRPDDDTPAILAELGLTLDAVPRAGLVISLSRIAHTWAGGGVTDVTDEVHPDVAAACIRAAQVIGIDIAGIDVMAEDISRPLEEQGGAVLEVNAGPGIALHFAPFCDRPRPVCESIIEHLFPHGREGRIPVVTVAASSTSGEVCRLLEHLLQGLGPTVGSATSQGVSVGRNRIKTKDSATTEGARALWLCPDVELAIVERSFGRIRQEGLGIDQCDVALITALGQGATGSQPDKDQARAAMVLVESVNAKGCLLVDVAAFDADLPTLGEIVERCPGEVILLSDDAGHLALRVHMDRGGKAILRRGKSLFVAQDACEDHLLNLDATFVDALGAPCLLPAIAAAWALRMPAASIAQGVSSYCQSRNIGVPKAGESALSVVGLPAPDSPPSAANPGPARERGASRDVW